MNATIVTIPSGWQRCDGSNITEGPLTGRNTPNLNGERYFLRGGDDFSVTTTENDMVQDHTHVVNDPGHGHNTGQSGGERTNLPVAIWNRNADPKARDTGDSGCFETQGSDCTTWGFTTASDHSHSVYSAESGITVGFVSSSYSKGPETRPKNMAVIYIMRILEN